MITTQKETVVSLLNLAELEAAAKHSALDALAQADQRYLRHLKSNLGNVLNSSQSLVNGCELCIRSHEESVLKHGATEAHTFDGIRLVPVVKRQIPVL